MIALLNQVQSSQDTQLKLTSLKKVNRGVRIYHMNYLGVYR